MNYETILCVFGTIVICCLAGMGYLLVTAKRDMESIFGEGEDE